MKEQHALIRLDATLHVPTQTVGQGFRFGINALHQRLRHIQSLLMHGKLNVFNPLIEVGGRCFAKEGDGGFEQALHAKVEAVVLAQRLVDVAGSAEQLDAEGVGLGAHGVVVMPHALAHLIHQTRVRGAETLLHADVQHILLAVRVGGEDCVGLGQHGPDARANGLLMLEADVNVALL